MEEEKIENLMDEKEIKPEHKKEQHKNNKFSHKDKKLNEKIHALEEQNKALNDKLLRVTAEMQNIKKRHEEEISRIYRYEGESLIKKLLDTIDNFERAISLDDNNLDDELSKFLSGFKLIYGKLKKDLDELNVKEMDCLDKPFDPNRMEAVMTEHIEGKDAGIVTEVMLKGYTYNDKVIRAAMVKVNE